MIIIVAGVRKFIASAIFESLLKKNTNLINLIENLDRAPFLSMNSHVSLNEVVKVVEQQLKREGARFDRLVKRAGVKSMNLAVKTLPNTPQKIVVNNLLVTMYRSEHLASLMLRSKQSATIKITTIPVLLGVKVD